jgi:hypothetical protein
VVPQNGASHNAFYLEAAVVHRLNLEMTSLLLDFCADPNDSSSGATVLQRLVNGVGGIEANYDPADYPAEHTTINMIKLLIESGATPFKPSPFGTPP